MEHIHAIVGPLATNVYVLADPSTREAIAIDTATPSLDWIAGALEDVKQGGGGAHSARLNSSRYLSPSKGTALDNVARSLTA